jgi:hypothetical protein
VRRRHRGARRSRTARLQSHERALFCPSSRVRVGLKHAQSLITGNRFAKKKSRIERTSDLCRALRQIGFGTTRNLTSGTLKNFIGT